MKGLRAVIVKVLPSTWEHVLRKEKKLQAFIEYVYRDLPSFYKGSYGWKEGVKRCKQDFSTKRINACFNAKNSKEGLTYWYGIGNKIIDYQNSLR